MSKNKSNKKLSNDQIILDTLIQQQKQDRDPESSESEFFEYFSSDQVLQEYDLSDEELQFGMVGDDHDGGIDSIYILVNGRLVQDAETHQYPKQNVVIKVVITQAKTETGFGEDTINKLIASTGELFDSQNSLDELKSIYNSKLLEIVGIFRDVILQTASLFPETYFEYFYLTRANSKSDVHENVARKTTQLEKTVTQLFPKSKYSFQFVGARELYESASKSKIAIVNLELSDTPIATTDGSYICLVNLKDYFELITFYDDGIEQRELISGIFESNVRDYEGDVNVNKSIQSTLDVPQSDEDFWWLNNGVTAIASEISQSGKKLTLNGLQIVNGLQTSMEIYNHYSEQNLDEINAKENRNILVRFIKCSNPASRDRIIKATNHQTRVPAASLRATDPFQEKIEDYLLTRGYFYERRKNYYKNQNKPRKNIVSITYLAQSIMAIALQEPNNAKGRPSTLLNDDEGYRRVFNPDFPWEVFYECI